MYLPIYIYTVMPGPRVTVTRVQKSLLSINRSPGAIIVPQTIISLIGNEKQIRDESIRDRGRSAAILRRDLPSFSYIPPRARARSLCLKEVYWTEGSAAAKGITRGRVVVVGRTRTVSRTRSRPWTNYPLCEQSNI